MVNTRKLLCSLMVTVVCSLMFVWWLREMWKFLVSEEHYLCNNIINIGEFCNLGVIMQLNTIYNSVTSS